MTDEIKRITNDMIAAEIQAVGPNIKELCVRLGMRYETLRKRIIRNPELQNIFNLKREERLDLSEAIIDTELKAGSLKAAMFILRTLGRDRGYVFRAEVTGEGGAPIQVQNIGPDFSSMTEEQYNANLQRLAEVVKTITG